MLLCIKQWLLCCGSKYGHRARQAKERKVRVPSKSISLQNTLDDNSILTERRTSFTSHLSISLTSLKVNRVLHTIELSVGFRLGYTLGTKSMFNASSCNSPLIKTPTALSSFALAGH